jgi:hypothetical protein
MILDDKLTLTNKQKDKDEDCPEDNTFFCLQILSCPNKDKYNCSRESAVYY